MTWSLRIRNGDLMLSGTEFDQVTGSNKLVQDLRCAILERQGTDDLHPDFGSLIDGGRDSNGNLVNSIIGGQNWNYMALIVESEIRRIASELQDRQVARAQQDRYTYGKATQTSGEVLKQISSVNMVQVQDSLVVQVGLITGSGEDIVLDIPVTNQSIISTS